MTKTLQQIKDEVSIEYDWVDWICFLSDCDDSEKNIVINEVCKRYAQEVNKELVKELEHVVKALETVSTFGATKPIIKHAKQLINKHKQQ